MKLPAYQEKEHQETYVSTTYQPKPMEPTSYAKKYEVPKYEITDKYEEKPVVTEEPYPTIRK